VRRGWRELNLDNLYLSPNIIMITRSRKLDGGLCKTHEWMRHGQRILVGKLKGKIENGRSKSKWQN
jgi:hypothetical protein